MSGTPPFVPGRIHGVRLWTVTVGCGSMALCGLNGSGWMAGGEPTRARCSPYSRSYGCSGDDDHSPAPDCSCGLYAMHPWPEQTSEVAGSLLGGGELAIPVMGIVEAWGRIEVHGDGIRAEFARPHALVLFPESFPPDYAEILAVLARTYQVGVLRFAEAESVVSYCAERAPGMDPTAVGRLLRSPPVELEPEPDRIDGRSANADGPKARSPGSFAKRAVELTLNAILVLLAIAWYGLWAAAGVFILGAIFLGWGDEPPPPPPKAAPQLRVLEQRVVRDGLESRYIAIVHNDSRHLAAVGVYPFGEFRDRHGHRRGGPDTRRKVELRPTIPPGGTGVVYDEIDRPLPPGLRPRVRFAARMAPSRRSPFRVGAVRMNRRLCIITTRLHSTRALARSRVAAVGRYDGRLAVTGTFTVGPVPRGTSTQVLYRLTPEACAGRLPRATGYPLPDPRQVVVERGHR